MNNVQKEIARKILQARKESGKTIKEVSEATGIPISSLGNYENGRYEPRMKKLEILAKYYGVPMTYFMDFDVGYATMNDMYEKLSADAQAQVQDYIKFLFDKEMKK